MAYSIDTYIGDGSTRIFSFTKPYIRKDDVTVSVNGSPVAFTWITDSSVQLATAPALGATVTIKRSTTLLSKEVDFVDGSSLTEHDLDLSMDQLIFSMQEVYDSVESTMTRDVDGSLQWDAQGYRIENVAAPVNNNDLVNKLWAETAMSSSLAQANTARDAAELAKVAAETAKDAAELAETHAEYSETLAGIAETNAAAHASAAATSASSASTSASLAAAAKVDAETAASNAATSAASAAASYDSFDDRYLGTKTADPTTDNDGNSLLVGALYWNSTSGQMRAWDGAAWKVAYMPSADLVYGLFYKADPTTVAFTKTGAGTASIKAGTKVDVAGTIVTFSSATSIAMPTLTAGTDYAIWVKDDATIQASSNFSSAPDSGNWRKIGGFHYAPGSNASAQAGGDTTPQINEYSFWDLKFRPACPDPRGMTLVADSFWADIYLLGVDHLTNGTSKYNVAIADGSSPPKIPTKFGGNGSTTYSEMTWWVASEVLRSHGKRPPTYDEFSALAYGTTEGTPSGGTNVWSTGVTGTDATSAWNVFTSRWGVIQASGCLYIWGAEFGGGAASAAWTSNTGGRGQTYQAEKAGIFGGYWGNLADAPGSRCSLWTSYLSSSMYYLGARGVCDHLIVD